MSGVHPAWVEHQRQRWLRPDRQRWMRHDAHLFMAPDPNSYRSYASRLVERHRAEEKQVTHDAEVKQLYCDHLALRRALADLKFELAWRRLCRKYNPNQPRRPKGDPEGPGEWVKVAEAGVGSIRLAQIGSGITDAFGNPYYQPGGHHEMPKQIYEKWDLKPATLKAFKDSTTGKLPPMMLRTSPDGVPVGNFWNGPNGAHGQYNQAVKELSESFPERKRIKPIEMEPSHARELLKEIRESNDPRIRDYNHSMRLLRRLFRLRTGRGDQ